MKKFGLYNNCWWMLISTMEGAIKHMNPLCLQMNQDYVIDSLTAGKVIAINAASGFHAGNEEDYTDIMECETYPTPVEA